MHLCSASSLWKDKSLKSIPKKIENFKINSFYELTSLMKDSWVQIWPYFRVRLTSSLKFWLFLPITYKLKKSIGSGCNSNTALKYTNRKEILSLAQKPCIFNQFLNLASKTDNFLIFFGRNWLKFLFRFWRQTQQNLSFKPFNWLGFWIYWNLS